MANEDSVLREVDQELAEDRQWQLFRKFGPAVIGGAAAVIIGVGAWQLYSAAQTRAASADAISFNEAAELLAESPAEGREALKAIAEDGDSGYGVLARFRRAGSLAIAGEREAAIAAFQTIYDNGGAPRSMRELARIRAAYLAIDDGRDAALSHLGSLTTSDGAFRPYADEVTGIAALKAEDYETALSVFSRLSLDAATPVALAARAEEFQALAIAGKSGVNITGEIRLDDIIGAVGESPVSQDDDESGDPVVEEAAETETTESETE